MTAAISRPESRVTSTASSTDTRRVIPAFSAGGMTETCGHGRSAGIAEVSITRQSGRGVTPAAAQPSCASTL
jgi:hypothetical protein